MTHLPPTDPKYNSFSRLEMDQEGRFLDDQGQPLPLGSLRGYFKQVLVLPDGVTDVFVWVHGWQTEMCRRGWQAARRMFQNIERRWASEQDRYQGLAGFSPAFVSVHWPSTSTYLPWGYAKIRTRAAALTERGEAEFFLSSLLGYLEDAKGIDGPSKGTLKSRGGFYVHCIGHSFGGRFLLTAAIQKAGIPESPRSGTLALTDRDRANGYRYSVDSILVFQMAAPRAGFAWQLERLVNSSPLGGPLVLTFSCATTLAASGTG